MEGDPTNSSFSLDEIRTADFCTFSLTSVVSIPISSNVLDNLRTFVKLRQITSNEELARRLDDLEGRYDQQFKGVFDAIRLLMNPKPLKRKEIGFLPKAEET
jgi:hypothetical protein